jgi:hypothetical protein
VVRGGKDSKRGGRGLVTIWELLGISTTAIAATRAQGTAAAAGGMLVRDEVEQQLQATPTLIATRRRS